MLGRTLKRFMPRGLYGRAALIVFVPVLSILLVFSVAFIQRHYDGVTRQMTANFVLVVDHILSQLENAQDPRASATALEQAFGLKITLDAPLPGEPAARLPFYDLSGQLAARELRAHMGPLRDVRLSDGDASIWLETQGGVVRVDFSLGRISARNPHQLLVLMAVIGIFMSLVSFVFLKNQMRPIHRMAVAAEAFGRGQSVPLRIGGATEVRAAGRAFVEMRERIERHIEQRTLLLSGVSHDLRTPLTRMRLAISLLEDEGDAQALLSDVEEMEALINQFLEFTRAQIAEDPELTDLSALLATRCAAQPAPVQGRIVLGSSGPGPFAMVRPMVLSRAVDNVLGNALRYGLRARIEVHVQGDDAVIEIEDAGPGIPADQVDRATRPFVRLDAARGANKGGGVGLGLAIVSDAMHSHGGRLELLQGVRDGYGGLRARLIVPLTAAGPQTDAAAPAQAVTSVR